MHNECVRLESKES